jgi:hypothetical protein
MVWTPVTHCHCMLTPIVIELTAPRLETQFWWGGRFGRLCGWDKQHNTGRCSCDQFWRGRGANLNTLGLGETCVYVTDLAQENFGLKIDTPRVWCNFSTALQAAKRIGLRQDRMWNVTACSRSSCMDFVRTFLGLITSGVHNKWWGLSCPAHCFATGLPNPLASFLDFCLGFPWELRLSPGFLDFSTFQPLCRPPGLLLPANLALLRLF